MPPASSPAPRQQRFTQPATARPVAIVAAPARGIDIDLPEVVIADNEVKTFAALVASIRQSRFDCAVPAAPNPDTPLEIKELPPVEPLEIEPIVRVAALQPKENARDEEACSDGGLAAIVCGSRAVLPWRRAAQEPSSPTSPKKVQNVPLELQVVIARYQGDKRVSSLPYVLSLKSGLNSTFAAGHGASLRLGSRVPIRTQVVTPRRRWEAGNHVELSQLRKCGDEHRWRRHCSR
jgi:hypothetical protein